MITSFSVCVFRSADASGEGRRERGQQIAVEAQEKQAAILTAWSRVVRLRHLSPVPRRKCNVPFSSSVCACVLSCFVLLLGCCRHFACLTSLFPSLVFSLMTRGGAPHRCTSGSSTLTVCGGAGEANGEVPPLFVLKARRKGGTTSEKDRHHRGAAAALSSPSHAERKVQRPTNRESGGRATS